MNYHHLWQTIRRLPAHSYSAACTCLVSSLAYYFIASQLLATDGGTIFQNPLYIGGLIAVFILSAYIGLRYYQALNQQDYKIGQQLHLLCFTMLFMLLIIILSSWLHNDFISIRPYIYYSLAILPAIFFYAKRAIHTISTGHLFFGIVMLSCISIFIPIAMMQLILKIAPLNLQTSQLLLRLLPIESAGNHSVLFLALGVSFVMLYAVTPFYLKERVFYKESKFIFARFATLIQLLLLPLYFILTPKIDGVLFVQSPAYQKFYLGTLAISIMLCLIGLYSILKCRQYWLSDANLLTKHIISPFILSALLIYLKIPHIETASFNLFFDISQQAQNSYFQHWFIGASGLQGDLLNYLPVLLAELLQDFTQLDNHIILINYSIILMHSLLIILAFYALSRFLPFLFTFAILFMVPMKFPEILLLISYASLLFDRSLLASSTRWSMVWFIGGMLCFILSPLYALFFLTGIIPYVIFTFRKFYLSNPKHTLNLLMIYSFAVIVMIFTPTMQILFHNILTFIEPNWLFNANFQAWGVTLTGQTQMFWQKTFFYMAFPIWLMMLIIMLMLLFPTCKKLTQLSHMSHRLGDWALLSCGLTMIISLPVLFNNLLEFDQSMTLNRFIYMIAFFGLPIILFRETLLFNKIASHFLYGVILLAMVLYNSTIIPNFYDIFTV